MPSWHRDPAAPAPNRPRKVGVFHLIELDRGAHRETMDAYLAASEEIVIA